MKIRRLLSHSRLSPAAQDRLRSLGKARGPRVAKVFLVWFPGALEPVVWHGLKTLAKAKGLDPSNLAKVAKGTRKHCKGYIVRPIAPVTPAPQARPDVPWFLR